MTSDHAAGHLALAVELGDAAPEIGHDLDPGDVTDRDRDASLADLQGDVAEIVQVAEITADPDHIFRLPALDHRSAALVVGGPERIHHGTDRNAI